MVGLLTVGVARELQIQIKAWNSPLAPPDGHLTKNDKDWLAKIFVLENLSRTKKIFSQLKKSKTLN